MIRVALRDEWPTIASWRAAHFADMDSRMKVPRETGTQKGFDDAVWLVYEKHQQPLAALSFAQDDDLHVAWMFDLYGAPGHGLAGLQLVKAFEQYCDDNGLEMRGETDPENTAYLRLVLARGYELTAICFARRPHQALSENTTSPGGGS